MKKKILGIITARAGSKRIPSKNTKLLNGKPLISYILTSAIKSKYIDRLIVSTNSKKIAEISKHYGADVPFLRPNKLAVDTISSAAVVKHAIHYLKESETYNTDIIILLQPTSPLCLSDDIDKVTELYLNNSKYDSVISVKRVTEHPEWLYKPNKKRYLEKAFASTEKYIRSQDTENYVIPNGAIYLIEIDALLKYDNFITERTGYYLMPPERSIDIDEELDFAIAESLIKSKKYTNN